MGQMKQWGLKLMGELTDKFVTGMSLQKAVDELVEETMQQGGFKEAERAWVRQQVQAVADHPEMFGHDRRYWYNLKNRKRT